MPTKDLDAPELLQASAGRTVVVEPGGAIVCKTFSGAPPPLARRLAWREFDRLERFSAALRDFAGAACPRPIEIVEGPTPRLRMERAPGISLPTLLGNHPLQPGTESQLASTIVQAVDCYIELFEEPYYDLHFRNMLYDRSSQTLTFVDYGFPDGSVLPPLVSPHDVSLGNLIGSTIFESARPKWLLRRRQHRQSSRLCAAIVARFLDARHRQVTLTGLRAASQAAYERSAFPGASSRRVWYASAGYLLAIRVPVGDFVFSPSQGPSGAVSRPAGTPVS